MQVHYNFSKDTKINAIRLKMKHNQHYSIDELIKEIYKGYIDFKTNEFDDIQKDMLLDNIKLLYTSIKDHPAPESKSSPKIPKKEEVKVEKQTPIQKPVEDPKKVVFDLTQKEVKSKNTPNPTEEPKTKYNPYPPIEESISKKENDTPVSVNNKKVDAKITPEVHNNDTPPPPLPEEKNGVHAMKSDQIIDYLKKDTHTKKSIYEILDLNTKIGLGAIFFRGDSKEFSECLDRLNKSNSLEDGKKIIDEYAFKNKIAEDAEIYKAMLNLYQRKLKYG